MTDLVQTLAAQLRRHPRSRGPTGSAFLARPPATRQELERTEGRLGFQLPPLLRRIYLEIANGGFGPGYGVMGVDGGFTDDQGSTIADLYELYGQGDPEDPAWLWPPRHIPICHWGCGVYSVVECDREGSPVYFIDPSVKEPGEPMATVMHPHKVSLDEWLNDWLEGKDLWAQVWG